MKFMGVNLMAKLQIKGNFYALRLIPYSGLK